MNQFLFYKEEFNERNAAEDFKYFEAFGYAVFLFEHEKEIRSFSSVPFASFFNISDKVDRVNFRLFVRALKEELKGKPLLLSNPPSSYHADILSYEQDLIECGFEEEACETAQSIFLQDFQWSTNATNRRKLRKLEALNARFEKLDVSYLDQAYPLLVEARERKGYPINVTEDKLRTLFIAFPTDFFLYGVYIEEELASVCVCVKVSPEVLYYFMPGDSDAKRSLSPNLFLAQHLIEEAKHEKYSVLDFGVSSEDGVINEGLFRFKKELGCEAFTKKMFRFTS